MAEHGASCGGCPSSSPVQSMASCLNTSAPPAAIQSTSVQATHPCCPWWRTAAFIRCNVATQLRPTAGESPNPCGYRLDQPVPNAWLPTHLDWQVVLGLQSRLLDLLQANGPPTTVSVGRETTP